MKPDWQPMSKAPKDRQIRARKTEGQIVVVEYDTFMNQWYCPAEKKSYGHWYFSGWREL